MLRKILREEKSMYTVLISFMYFLFMFLTPLSDSVFTKMATRYSKDKYARVKGMKNEPLSQVAIEMKKRKLNNHFLLLQPRISI